LPFFGAVEDFNGKAALDGTGQALHKYFFGSQVSLLAKESPFTHALID